MSRGGDRAARGGSQGRDHGENVPSRYQSARSAIAGSIRTRPARCCSLRAPTPRALRLPEVRIEELVRKLAHAQLRESPVPLGAPSIVVPVSTCSDRVQVQDQFSGSRVRIFIAPRMGLNRLICARSSAVKIVGACASLHPLDLRRTKPRC